MRAPRPKLRLSLIVIVLAGFALMWWWPTKAPPEPGAPEFPPRVPSLPDDGGAPTLDAGLTLRD